MAGNTEKTPSKGILKTSSSTEHPNQQHTTWDEMNIIATFHPADKDYGYMKVLEPDTPFNYVNVDDVHGVDPTELAQKIRMLGEKPPKALVDKSDDNSEDEELPEEVIKRRKEFELKRRKFYNEFYALHRAQKHKKENDDDKNEDGKDAKTHKTSCSCAASSSRKK